MADPGDDAKEVVDLTELSDAEDDLVVCQVSLPSNNQSTDCRFGRLIGSQEQTPSAPPLAHHLELGPGGFHRHPRPSHFPSHGSVNALRPVGPFTPGHHHHPLAQGKIGCDSAQRREGNFSVQISAASPVAFRSGGGIHVGTPPYESQFHHHLRQSNVALRHGPPLSHGSPFRCIDGVARQQMVGNQVRESAPICIEQRHHQTPSGLDSPSFTNVIPQRPKQGRVASMMNPRLSRQGEWKLVDRNAVQSSMQWLYFK